MRGFDFLVLHRDGDGAGVELLLARGGVGGVNVQVEAGYDIEVVPQLVVEIVQLPYLGVKQLHHFDYRAGLRASLLAVRNLLHLFYHLKDIASVFRHLKLLSLGVVIKPDVVCRLLHILSNNLKKQI